jgi:flagellar motor switch protein FliN/FliY
VYIGEKLIARGELQEIEGSEGKLGVRLTQVVDLQNGF